MEEETVHEGGREDEDDSLGGSGNAAITKKHFVNEEKKAVRERTYTGHSTQPASSSPLPSPSL